MFSTLHKLLITLLLLLIVIPCFAMEKAVYVLRGENLGDYQDVSKEIATMKRHPGAVDLIISQAYQLDDNGTVWGKVNKRLEAFAKQQKIRFMPMVTNHGFDKARVHRFLSDKQAQQTAITDLVTLAKQHQFYGIQVDFEHVGIVDRDALTQFYKNLASAMHSNGFKISAALFPLTNDIPQTSTLKAIYNSWAGAYDYQKLGEYSDFVTIMGYNQHAGSTTPGPSAGLPWLENVVKYTLQKIPAKKVSLGIPVDSEYWRMVYSNGASRAAGSAIDHQTMRDLLKKYRVKLQWDAKQHVPYAFYTVDQFNQFIFAENAQSFRDKLALIKRYQLRGFSMWRLGVEDPAIWSSVQ